ncbi:MAG: hypothetical protein JOZ24_07515, partial [Candidatus Eremiobacteraeota bacterium]|nr:hypothetical protein [Candidatus Eremiobacteraeota bacterium]
MFLDAAVRRISELAVADGASKEPSKAITVEAQDAVARTLARGLPLAADATGALAKLAVIAPPAMGPAPEGSGALAFVRSRPALGTLDTLAVPPWAHGMAVSASIGPLVDENGIGAWIDTILPAPTKFALTRGVGGPAIAYVIASQPTIAAAGGTTTVTFGAGSAWLVVQLLDVHAPANAYAGLAFESATLTVPGVLSSPAPQTFALPAGATGTFDCRPVASTPPPAPTPPLTNDGAAALATLPPDVRFAFQPGATKVTALADGALTVYGATVRVGGGPGAAVYDAPTQELAVRYADPPSPAQLAVAASVSPTFMLRGTAALTRASYRIPVALTTPDALAPAAGGGALGLDCGAGFTARWGALRAPVAARAALLHVATGVLGVAIRTTARAFADTYALWDAHNAAGEKLPATLTLGGPRNT